MRVGEAEEEAQPPQCQHVLPVLNLYDDLRFWDCLPVDGGYFDQPALLMKFLKQIRLAYADYREIQEINRRLGEGADEDSSRPGEQAPTLMVKIPLPFHPDKPD